MKEGMDLSSHLNTAHKLVRKADRAIQRGKFDEAIEEQDNIVKHLRLARERATDRSAIQSLECQIEYHNKQKKVIRLRKERCLQIAKNLETIQQRMEKANLMDADNLQDSINRTFQETESLLQHLKQGAANEQEEVKLLTTSSADVVQAGLKQPKNDKDIIEELQTANNHLRNMVDTMFGELEACRRENAELRARVADLEAEKVARIVRDIKESPATALISNTTTAMSESGNLPPLAPLEMPDFDFSAHK